jgi:hypothetical protein
MAESERTVTTANPLGAGAADAAAAGAGSAIAPPSAAADEIDVEAGLKDGTLSPNEAIVHMQRQITRQKWEMARQERATAGVEEQLGGGGAPLAEALIRKVLGRHTEAPTIQHQVASHLGRWSHSGTAAAYVLIAMFHTKYTERRLNDSTVYG